LGANAIAQVSLAAIQIFSIPLFLQAWGKNQYGEWLLITAVPAYLSLCDLGFASVASTQMTMQTARDDRVGAINTFHSAILLACISTVIFTLLLTCALYFMPSAVWSNIRTSTPSEIKLILGLMSIYVLLGLQNELVSAALRCGGFYALATYITTAIRLLEFAFVVCALIYGATATWVAWTYLASRLTGFVILGSTMRYLLPWLTYEVRHASWSAARGMAPSALAYLGFPLGNALSMQGAVLIVGSILGSAQVATFVTFRTITRAVNQLMSLINNAYAPELSRAYGAGDMSIFKHMYAKACQSSLLLSFAVVIFLFIFGEFLIRIWTVGKIDPDFGLLTAFVCSAALNSLWFTPSVILAATNKHQKMAIAYLIGTSLCLILTFLTISTAGLIGVAIAQSISELVMIAFVLTSVTRLFKIQIKDIFVRTRR
jgi:O-antigen/teichoic acid export membrane protein